MFNFNEDLLQYIWKLQYFNFQDLTTTDGVPVSIIYQGTQNHDSGPDFSEAKIIIDKTQWVGNVEIHILSSDWHKHDHSSDEAYDNIILHVVYEEDLKIHRSSKQIIPCIELKGRIPKAIFDNYLVLKSSEKWIRCENLIHNVDDFKIKLWLQNLAVERLEIKCQDIKTLLSYTNNDLEYAFFILLGKYFGAINNQVPFELLCKNFDMNILYKNKDNPLAIEAMFFGMAGFLNSNFKDDYPKRLKKEYAYLKHKYNLREVSLKLWKFFRLRPNNFPTIRIAQFVDLIQKNDYFFSKILHFESFNELKSYLEVSTNYYWEDHYLFDRPSSFQVKNIGNNFLNVLITNAIIPFIFHFGKIRHDEHYTDKAMNLMLSIPPEINSITKKWKQKSIVSNNVLESQALIHLKKEYCNKNRCLECVIGHEVIKDKAVKYQRQNGRMV